MIVYSSTKEGFLDDFDRGLLIEKIHHALKDKNKGVSPREEAAWHNSLSYMSNMLSRKNKISDEAGIAIEYIVPNTQKRVDFIITGKNQKQEEHVVVVELKQWQKAEKVDGMKDIVKSFVGGRLRELTHPSYQAWSYCSLIEDFNATVQEEHIQLHPCSYLHNYDETMEHALRDDVYKDILDKSPMFCSSGMQDLRNYISKYIQEADDSQILERIEHGKLRPSKSLQDCILKMLQGQPEFTLIDNQKVAFENILSRSLTAIKNQEKLVCIVHGGPGTGKSVIAINLLVRFLQEGIMAQYVSKNSAPRAVYESMLRQGWKKKDIASLFSGSGSFYNLECNSRPITIVDEAHRLTEKSGMYANVGEDQVKEIIEASKVSIFFIDRNQRVTFKDAGTVDKIRKYAKKSLLYEIGLESQFRCNGSDGYLAWLDNLLEIRKTANFDGFDGDYDFKVFRNPQELRQAIIEKNKVNNKSRLVAGYCWDWISKKEGIVKKDIVFPKYNFAMNWNLASSLTYAIDEGSIEQVGCIHTTQGLEFEYVGVIIGDDLRYENGHLLVDVSKRARTDQSIKGLKKLGKKHPIKAKQIGDEIVKNTYRTLMTRGQKGCYVYCTDKKLADYIEETLQKQANMVAQFEYDIKREIQELNVAELDSDYKIR